MVNRLERLAASTGETEGKGRRRRVQRAEPSLDLAAPAQVCCRGSKSSLARLGQGDQAAEIARHVLRIEPKFTLNRLRVRLTFMDEGVWRAYADGMRLAGLPE